MPRGSRKGERRGGRKKGTPNKVSLTVKQTVLETARRLGGVERMVEWAEENLSEFYRIYAKLLPTEIANADGAFKVQNVVEVVVKSREEADKVLALNKGK